MRALLYIFLLVTFCCQGVVIATYRSYVNDYEIVARAMLDEFGDSAMQQYWRERRLAIENKTGRLKRRPLVEVKFEHGLLTVKPFLLNTDSMDIAYLTGLFGDNYSERLKRRILMNLDTLRLGMSDIDYFKCGYSYYWIYLGDIRVPRYNKTYIYLTTMPCLFEADMEDCDMSLIRKRLEENKKNVYKQSHEGGSLEQLKGIPFLEYPLKELLKDSVKPDSTWHHPIFG